jgi:formylglycine-generating enzyme required for sulfatase activity
MASLMASSPNPDSVANLADMVRLDGGSFIMGSDRHYAEEAPRRMATVEAFWIDPAPVTNRQFAEFVDATGYVTLAETVPTLEEYPDADPRLLKAGSAVFQPASGPIDLRDHTRWWRYVFGACWRDPDGTGRGIANRLDHPVVQIAYQDALAYAAWAGKALPTEAEWEYAARGGTTTSRWWGEAIGTNNANCNGCGSPYDKKLLAPVDAFAANPFGLYGVLGNAWEWVEDCWHDSYRNAPGDGGVWSGGDCSRHVLRGGSWDNVPLFVRAASRSAAANDDGDPKVVSDYSSLAGFRLARDLP